MAIADWNDNSVPGDVIQTRIICLFCEAIYTTWLQAIWHRGLKGNQCFIGLCPWDSATLPYKGACRESPLRQTFSFDSMRRSPEEKRRHELERARLYRGKSKAENRPLSRPIREAHNEAHRESRRRDTPKLRRKRLARKHECSWPGCRRCMSCGEEGHYFAPAHKGHDWQTINAPNVGNPVIEPICAKVPVDFRKTLNLWIAESLLGH